MDLKTLLPTLRRTTALRSQPIPPALVSPYPEMSRVFEDLFSVIARAPWANAAPQALTTARIQVGETDQDISIITELPGLAEQDVEVLLDDDLLTVRAEKKSASTSGRELPDPQCSKQHRAVQRRSSFFLVTAYGFDIPAS